MSDDLLPAVPPHAPTMYVEIDGAIEERPVAHVGTPTFGIVERAQRAYPVLHENEQAIWTTGNEIPTIVKVRE